MSDSCSEIIKKYEKLKVDLVELSQYGPMTTKQDDLKRKVDDIQNQLKGLKADYENCKNKKKPEEEKKTEEEKKPEQKPCFKAEWEGEVPKCPKCTNTGATNFFIHRFSCKDRGKLPCPRGSGKSHTRRRKTLKRKTRRHRKLRR